MTTYRADLSFDAWFTRILVNTCLDHLKARRRAPFWAASHESAAAELVPSGEPSAERRLLAQARWRELSAAVAQLPARQRDVFLLTHLDQQAPQTIAQVLGMSAATVRVHLFRALRKLRINLGDSA
jgi:RNA polymerase sigma-70 factor (ECF subfamily)